MGLFGKGKKIFDSTATVHYTDTYTLGGETIRCGHCGHDKFDIGSALLNTPGMTSFGFDWANRCRRSSAAGGVAR
jgi:hypothetical protein